MKMRLITVTTLISTLTFSNALEHSLLARDPEPELFPSNWAILTPRPSLKSAQADLGPFALLAGLASPSTTGSYNDNGPELDNAPEARRSFSSLTTRYERRQGCPGGYGSCNNSANTCCPIGGDCCGNGRCCGTGDWCYSTGCCSRAEKGCDNQGCCPVGSQCCKGGRCCEAGYNCVVVDGQKGCCPIGKICSSGPPSCTRTGYFLCPSQEYCCPSGSRCVRGENNAPQCRDQSPNTPPPPPPPPPPPTSITTTTRVQEPTPIITPKPPNPPPPPSSTLPEITSEASALPSDSDMGLPSGLPSVTSSTTSSTRSTSTRVRTTLEPLNPTAPSQISDADDRRATSAVFLTLVWMSVVFAM